MDNTKSNFDSIFEVTKTNDGKYHLFEKKLLSVFSDEIEANNIKKGIENDIKPVIDIISFNSNEEFIKWQVQYSHRIIAVDTVVDNVRGLEIQESNIETSIDVKHLRRIDVKYIKLVKISDYKNK